MRQNSVLCVRVCVCVCVSVSVCPCVCVCVCVCVLALHITSLVSLRAFSLRHRALPERERRVRTVRREHAQERDGRRRGGVRALPRRPDVRAGVRLLR